MFGTLINETIVRISLTQKYFDAAEMTILES